MKRLVAVKSSVLPVTAIWRDVLPTEPPGDLEGARFLRLSPLKHGTDGFFAATLVRKEPVKEARSEEAVAQEATPENQLPTEAPLQQESGVEEGA